MDNKINILYIADHKIRNKKFLQHLSHRYKVDVCNQVISSDFAIRRGFFDNFKFSSDFPDNNSAWNIFINNLSKENFACEYGLDAEIYLSEEKPFIYGNILFHFLKINGFSLLNDTSINDVILKFTKRKNVKKEIDVYKYKLIIVENLISPAVYERKYEDGWVQAFPYIFYRIMLSTIKRYLNENGSILFLMDHFSILARDHESELWLRFNNILEKLNISNFFIPTYAEKDTFANLGFQQREFILHKGYSMCGLQCKDNEQSISGDDRAFKIPVTKQYLYNIPNHNRNLYEKVDCLRLNSPSLILPLRKEGVIDVNKIILTTNNSTKLFITECRVWDEKKHKYTFDNIKDEDCEKNVAFGVMDNDKKNSYCILTGNLCSDMFFDKSDNNNNQFVHNVIERLINHTFGNKQKQKPFEPIPNVEMVIKDGLLTIENIKISLTQMQFCYYRYFAERVINRQGYQTIEVYDFETPSQILSKILEFHKESFPNIKSKLEISIKSNKDKSSPPIDIIRTHLNGIKNKIISHLKNTDYEKYSSNLYINNFGNHNRPEYGIDYPPEKINIKPFIK